MYGFVSGISDTDFINFCPKCGAEIGEYTAEGIGICKECGFRFAVIEDEDDCDVEVQPK